MKSNDYIINKYNIGDLIQPSEDYIEGSGKKPVQKFGIVIQPEHEMWGYGEKASGTKVQWASGHEEIVWHFEIEKAKK
jgi:hypothetical protein